MALWSVLALTVGPGASGQTSSFLPLLNSGEPWSSGCPASPGLLGVLKQEFALITPRDLLSEEPGGTEGNLEMESVTCKGSVLILI